MPEILTESFCERCGTRYTFESAAPRTPRLKGVRVLSRGLKNFVMSDDTSLDEAMAAARSDTDREVTSQQLDAFHKTFNFCMSCRQYTCANCWNEAEGRCLTCAPHLGHDILEAPFPTLAASTSMDLRVEANGNGTNGHHHDPTLDTLAWPTTDLMRDDGSDVASADDLDADGEGIEPIDAVARLAALGATPSPGESDAPAAAGDEAVTQAADEAPVPIAAAAIEAGDAAAEPVAAALADVAGATHEAGDDAAAAPMAPAPKPSDIDQRAAAAAAATADLLRAFRPGQSLDAALDAYEREQATAAGAPVAASDPAAGEPGPEADHLAAAAADAAADVAATAHAARTPAPAWRAPDPEPARPTDRGEQPTWQIMAPDHVAPGHAAPTDVPTAPSPAASAEPQWPAQPQWPSHASNVGLPFLGRPATPTGGIDALWAESAREVSSVPMSDRVSLAPVGAAKVAGGVQPCVSCGLSLSATARFCRRCGSRQG